MQDCRAEDKGDGEDDEGVEDERRTILMLMKC
jgi:hypothetical protein